MQIQINPIYGSLCPWIVQLPQSFAHSGTILYNARNQIRVIMGPDNLPYNVKRYCSPKWYNKLVYTFFRSPKAERAYHNALRLQSAGIPTPTVIAYLLQKDSLLAESYLVTEQICDTHTLYELGDGIVSGREEMITALGRFTGRMHNRGILHLDYSPGNVLYRRDNQEWQFWVVDINRMHFGEISPAKGCENTARLWGEENMYQLLAKGYAEERNLDSQTCYEQMWKAHQQFWRNRKIPSNYTARTVDLDK